jgi:hypothetical protein
MARHSSRSQKYEIQRSHTSKHHQNNQQKVAETFFRKRQANRNRDEATNLKSGVFICE